MKHISKVIFIVWMMVGPRLLAQGPSVFAIHHELVCWASPDGNDSTLYRYVTVNPIARSEMVYRDAWGNNVNVTGGGLFFFGACGCCANVPPADLDTVPSLEPPVVDSTDSFVQVVNPMPPYPDSVLVGVYGRINNVSDTSQISAVFNFAISSQLQLTAPGYVNNAAGSITWYYYNQLEPDKAEFYIEFWFYLLTAPFGDTPAGRIVTVDNGQGIITNVDGFWQ